MIFRFPHPGRSESGRRPPRFGLTEASDPDMERYVDRVRAALKVPVALVSLVQTDQQVFPGASGLPSPWAERRATPLSHSFSQFIARSGEPLVIADAREDPLVRDNPAVTEFGAWWPTPACRSSTTTATSWAPCAPSTRSPGWTEDELRLLHDLAQDCRNDLRLRLSPARGKRERERRGRGAAPGRDQPIAGCWPSPSRSTGAHGGRDRRAALPAARLHPGFCGPTIADALRHVPHRVVHGAVGAFQRNVVGLGRSVCRPVVGSSGSWG